MKKIFNILFILLITLTINTNNVKAQEIPKIFIEGKIEDIEKKDDERKVKIHYISNDLEFTSYVKLKIQGNSSINYEKKNYTIKLYKNKEFAEKKDVDFGWGAQHKYVLKANWIDKTHSRNIVTSNIIASIQNKYNLFKNAPNNGEIDGFPIEVYTNNNFLGLYTLNIPKDNWTFNMDNNNPNHIVMAANENNKSTNFKEEATLENWEIEVGEESEETLEKFNRLIKFIKDSSDQEFKDNFNKYLNLDATLNYYCILNYANLSDNISKNILMITYDGKIWSPILYDLDTSWGTNWNGTSTTDYDQDLTKAFNENLLWKKLEKNFPNEIANRYFELRKSILTKENITKQFKNYYKKIPIETINKEKEKWINIPGYSISQIDDFLKTRTPIIDKNMYNLYDTIPTISIEYSTKKTTFKPVTVTLNTNRSDIIIIKNNKKSYDYTYTFKENGNYTYEYQDWYGNYLGTITITINNIYTKTLKNILFSIVIILIGTTLCLTSKRKKEELEKKKEEKRKEKELNKEEKKQKKASPKKTNKTSNKQPKKQNNKKKKNEKKEL